MSCRTSTTASSYTPIPHPFPYPPPPKSSLIRRAIATYRYRKLKREWKSKDAERMARELKNGPGQPYRPVSKASLSEYYSTKFVELSHMTTPTSVSSDIALSPAVSTSTAPTTPASDDQPLLVEHPSHAAKGNSQGTARETATLTNALRLEFDYDDDLDLSLLELEGVQAFLSGFCGSAIVPEGSAPTFPSSRTLKMIPRFSSTIPTPSSPPSPVEAKSPEDVKNAIDTTAVRPTKGARLLQGLKLWVDQARSTHVGTPVFEERPMAGRDFEMNWATIAEEDEDDEDEDEDYDVTFPPRPDSPFLRGYQSHDEYHNSQTSGSYFSDSDSDDDDFEALVGSFPSTPTYTSSMMVPLCCDVVILLNGVPLDLDAEDFGAAPGRSTFGAYHVSKVYQAGHLAPLPVFQAATLTVQDDDIEDLWPDFEWTDPLL